MYLYFAIISIYILLYNDVYSKMHVPNHCQVNVICKTTINHFIAR